MNWNYEIEDETIKERSAIFLEKNAGPIVYKKIPTSRPLDAMKSGENLQRSVCEQPRAYLSLAGRHARETAGNLSFCPEIL